MRPLKLSLAVAGMFAVALLSCKKDGVAPVSSNSISLNFDSMSYNTTNVQITNNFGSLELTGIFNSQTEIWLSIQNPQTGSFDIASNAGDASFTAGSSDEYMANEGSINVTAMTDSTVAGTFRFHCVEIASGGTCNIINGTFKARYK